MRSLSDALTAAQKSMGDVLCKIVLTLQSDSTTYTYGVDTTDRILNLAHPEQEWSQTAQITVNDSSGTLAALTLEGCSAVISYGYHTTTDEYSPTAPLEVIASKSDSMPGQLVTTLSLAGVFNMMGVDEASVAYVPEDTNGDTIKIILTALANKTMTCFSHCKSYTIVFDDEVAEESFWAASLINTFKPRDYFRVGFKESRLSAFQKALAYTGDKARIEDDGYIHVFRPTISGTTYDYEYNDAIAATNHNFFDKSVRKRLVIPNKVIVSNHPVDHEDTYTGIDTDSDSYTALGRYIIEHHYVRPTSDTQCDLIADAILQNYQLAAEKGHGFAPMNVGQEVMDYVKITDSRADDTRIGNIGFLQRNYRPGRFDFEFRFGSLFLQGLAGTVPPWATEVITREPSYDALYDYINARMLQVVDYVNEKVLDLGQWFVDFINEGVVAKWHVTHQMIIPVWLPTSPLVTTQAVSDVLTTTATGNGTITSLGVPNPTAYGVCWSESEDPTTADDTTDEGAATETGAFTTDMEDLTTGTKYYVRAYATNDIGTSYGAQVDFTTD